MEGFNLVNSPYGKAFVVRTSDRINFRKCRRRWAWSSHLKANLGPKNLASPLWFGSAIHYALEDFHGYRKFEEASDAFQAYCVATAKNYKRDLPDDAADLLRLGTAMMQYYQHDWLEGYGRQADQTLWLDGIPQVEVTFEIPIYPEPDSILAIRMAEIGCDVILYRGTFDRVAIDENGMLWIVEYKTAKRAEVMHFMLDSQISTYVWACSQVYEQPVAGVIYQQFIKKEPELPPVLVSGQVSTASNLYTSYPLYRKRLMNIYGSVERAPKKNVDFLWDVAQGETQDRDRYIIRDKVFRNQITSISEYQKILLELEDMMNPNLPLYPNPGRDCTYMCSFNSACISFDDGSDWEEEMSQLFSSRSDDLDHFWRRRIVSASELVSLRESRPSFEGDLGLFNIEAVQREAVSDALTNIEDSFFTDN